ncbi:MAG: FecR domain-containing protein [Chloroflexi bacterium]|nr:FecR domain-containing protein [Chloroflexota bacterium]
MSRKILFSVLMFLALAGLACSLLGGASTSVPASTALAGTRSAQLSELKNEVQSRASSTGEWQSAVDGAQVAAGGGVKTGDDSRVRLDISDGTILRLAPQTEFELKQLSPEAADSVTQLTLTAGKMWAAVTTALGGGSFDVETPVGVATVRGSYMSVEYFPANGQMITSCLEGKCRLTSSASNKFTDLNTGQQSGIPGFGQDPSPAKPIDIAQIRGWSVEFPEAAQFVATLTPGPEPTATPAGTPPAGGGAGGQVIGGGSAGQTACDHPYFPIRAGATWTYSTPDGPMTWSVSEVTGDTTSAAAVVNINLSAGQITYHWQCDANGLTSYDFVSLNIGQLSNFVINQEVIGSSGVWLPAAELLQPGYAWSFAYQLKTTMTVEGQTFDGATDVSQDSAVTGAESVTVGGATYDGLQIGGNSVFTSQMQIPGGLSIPPTTSNSTFTDVYARGVGLVSAASTSDGSTYSYELTSFSIP